MNTRDRINSVKNIIRAPYSWPSGYAKLMVMNDGGCLCADCVKDHYGMILRATRDSDSSGWEAYVAIAFNTGETKGKDTTDLRFVDEKIMEGMSFKCGNCNEELPSGYGDPESV